MLTMVDRATPTSAADLAFLLQQGIGALALYVGGITDGGRAWQPADAARARAAGLQVLPIYVGQNVVPGFTPTETAAQGTSDGADAVGCAQRYGFGAGPLCLDVEYATYTGDVAGALAYMEAWGDAVAAAGFLPVMYAPLAATSDYQPRAGHPTGLWLADWDQVGNLSAFPNAARFTGIGWQYADSWNGYDISHVDGAWWGQPKPDHMTFPQTGHTVAHGFYDFWLNRGGLKLFGFPITEELAQNGLTVQYFERARFEWHPGAAPDGWDTLLGLIGSEHLAADTLIASLQAQLATLKPAADLAPLVADAASLVAAAEAYLAKLRTAAGQ